MSLQALKIEAVENTGKELGRGAYGVVVELKVHRLRCAGKKIHDEFFTTGAPNRRRDIHGRFAEECILLSCLRHPNIVQFLGIHEANSGNIPMLVMEYLPLTLSKYVEDHPGVPSGLKYSILLDVGLGLVYLHCQTPPLIHRDLTANNVLLTSGMQAKIADLGMAKIVQLNPAQISATMTQCPGTPAYMPPEALSDQPAYDTSLDSFSFGNLVLHTVLQQWPLPLPILRSSGSDPAQMTPRSEVERRAPYVEKLGETHPLKDLTVQCLQNHPQHRPTATKIVEVLEHVSASDPRKRAHSSQAEDQTYQRERSNSDSEVKKLRQELQSQHQLLQARERELRYQNQVLLAKQEAIKSQTKQIQANGVEIQAKAEEIAAKGKELAAKDGLLKAKERVVACLTSRIDSLCQSSDKFPYLLEPNAKIVWSRSLDLPMGMRQGQATVLGAKVYYGGGSGAPSSHSGQNIYAFDFGSGRWETLPRVPYLYSALVAYRGQLVLVGGQVAGSGMATNRLTTWDEQKAKWVYSLPPMSEMRSAATAITYQSLLLVAGGFSSGVPLNSIEVFGDGADTWRHAPPLPVPTYFMKSACHRGYWYVAGGQEEGFSIFRASLDSLCTSSESAATVWSGLPNVPFDLCSLAIFGQTLVSVGGKSRTGQRSSHIRAYCPHSNPWVHIGDMPVEASVPTTVSLPTGELLVLGGRTNAQDYSTAVHRARLVLT